MIINDKNGLLKVMDNLLEELDQNAAGPELERAAELDNEATLERAPHELTPAYTNDDMYGEDEEFAEDVGEVVYESEQLAAGPELERAAELKNEATLEKAPRELTADVDNEDIYGDDEDFAEDVGEVVVEANLVKLHNKAIAARQNFHNTEAKRLEKKAAAKHAAAAEAEKKSAGSGATHTSEANSLEDMAVKRRAQAADSAQHMVGKTDVDSSGQTAKKQHHWFRRIFGGQNNRVGVKSVAQADTEQGRNTFDTALSEEFSDLDLMEILQENGFAASLNNLILFKEGLENGKYSIFYEEELETEVMPGKAEDEGVADDKPAERAEDTDEKKEDSEEKEEKKSEEDKDEVNEGLAGIFALINQINESLSQEAAGPELGASKELKNEATKESEGSELTSTVDSKDVYSADEHEQKEDVGEVVVKESESGDDKNVPCDKQTPEWCKKHKPYKIIESDQNAAGPELGASKELKNEATAETAEKELTSDKDNKDLFPAEEHEQKEDVGEVVVKESEQLAAGPELGSAKELDNEATEEKAPKTAPASTDNKDVYCDDCHKQVEDVVEVVIEAVSVCKEKGIPATLENITEEVNTLLEIRADSGLVKQSRIADGFAMTKQGKYEPEMLLAKNLGGVKSVLGLSIATLLLTYSIVGLPVALGTAIATSIRSARNKDILNSDAYQEMRDAAMEDSKIKAILKKIKFELGDSRPDKQALKDLEAELKVELRRFKEDYRSKQREELKESEDIFVALDEAYFDIDAFIMSKEMNGSKKFEEYEKLEGKGAECALTGLRESVKYNSLKEACMMDEGYFAEDSYVKETADEKVAKLTEQVSILMAREANDPLYDELLKESAYCMRLREQIQTKYSRAAGSKVEMITEAKPVDKTRIPKDRTNQNEKHAEEVRTMRTSIQNDPASQTFMKQHPELFKDGFYKSARKK